MRPTRVGISGWRYAGWRGRFYPAGLPQKDELRYVSRRLNSIELNGTFYSLPKPAHFQRWHDETPAGFVFAVKANQFITHVRRLRDVEGPLANFFASGVLALKEKLGPVLWQFPPSLAFDRERFERFLEQLPHDTVEAARLAAGHDAWMAGRSWLEAGARRPVRHAVEFRHPSFRTEEFVELLRRHGVALVVADTARRFPYLEDMTADFVYARLHGDEELHASGYSEEALGRWAARFRIWRSGGEPRDARRAGPAAKPGKRGRDLFIYFDNDAKVRAPFDAMALARRLGLKRPAAGRRGA